MQRDRSWPVLVREGGSLRLNESSPSRLCMDTDLGGEALRFSCLSFVRTTPKH